MRTLTEDLPIRFFSEDKEIKRETAGGAPILAHGSIVGAFNEVYAFEDERSFLKWAEKFPVGEKFLKLHNIIESTRELERTDLSEIQKVRMRRTEMLTKELEDLSKRSKLPVNSLELFLKATTGFDPLEGPIFDPSIIYQHINFGGSWRPLIGTMPDFRWILFNDKASSMRVSGAGILFKDTWYRGRRFYFGGIPIMNFPDFRLFAFNDMASSAALI